MTSQLTAATEAGAERLGRVSSVVASLPISLAPANGARADLVAIAGSAGWAKRATEAVADGSRGIIVVSPVRERVDELELLADSRNVPVVLDYRWAAHAAIAAARKSLPDSPNELALVDLTMTVSSRDELQPSFEDAARVLSRLFTPSPILTGVRQSADSVVAVGTLHDSVPVTLTVLVAPPQAYPVRVHVITHSGDVDLRLPDPDTARPATVTVTDARGSTQLPTVFESSHRHAWRRVVELVRTNQISSDLTEFREASGSSEME